MSNLFSYNLSSSIGLMLLIILTITSCYRNSEAGGVTIDTKSLSVEELTNMFSQHELEHMYHLSTIDESQQSFSLDDTTYLLNSQLKDLKDAYWESQKAIRRGRDNRKDLFQVSDPDRIINAHRVLAVTPASNLLEIPGTNSYVFKPGYHRGHKICSNAIYKDPFFGQPKAGSGTYFAIDSNLIVTAGHNITRTCNTGPYDNFMNLAFIFDFGKWKKSENTQLRFSKTEVFYPDSVLYCCYGCFGNKGLDLAIIRTDKNIPEDRIVELSSNNIKDSASVYTIGHPYGLPLKVADSALVTKNIDNISFSASLDVFNGNSGSPVFDSLHQVVGVLVEGSSGDYYKPNLSTCWHIKYCGFEGQTCPTVRIIRSSILLEILNQLNNSSTTSLD